MRYRKLDADGDYVFGNGAEDFWRDVPDAPAQAVKTRFQLKQGDWFLDKREGMPYATRVLGNRTTNTRDQSIRLRAIGTQGVRGILSYSSDTNRDTRSFTVDLTIDTIYGRARIVEPI